MCDSTLLKERIERLLILLNRIPDRFSTIQTPADFLATKAGVEHLDSICMVLIAVGEKLKKIDRQTSGTLLSKFPGVTLWECGIFLLITTSRLLPTNSLIPVKTICLS